MDIREVRRARLLQLVHDQKGKGKQRKLAGMIGKAPAQVSQWINHKRTITEDTAREIESRARKPAGWMDLDPNAPNTTGNHSLVADGKIKDRDELRACRQKKKVAAAIDS